ncbi:hypothetical protein PV382_15410 [Streptomyces scabiei]|uniref:hypothetical protein n=1 Tax=Streptomyces scabiei TaxID=1930 RepID=UPI0029ADFA37|nr:hypothetical protein [Streptomyces scabiei]MDX2994104.1 hypothetical protein [Streptomyces scabiei]MDX3029080.1 hypothetical protein [Streptomyces scabiei]MDX3047627.1 hypothetical protein [Streptomyces scabiei]MDX3173674.1 hypothetical protein [Streptomyces scabiei]
MSNPDYDAAWASVPAVVHCERQLRALEARKSAVFDALGPDQARRAFINEAVKATREGGADFPDDIGAKAAAVYRDALEVESERIALHEATTSLRNHLDYLRETEAELALEALGERLGEFLANVRKVAPDLKGAMSAEEAVQKGGKAPAAWKYLTEMLGRLRSIRDAQYRTLRPLGDGQRLNQLRQAGHFEVAGLQPGDVPADILRAMTSGQYDVPYLVYLANHSDAWVPGSWDEFEGEDAPDIGTPDAPLGDYMPREEIIPEPPALKLTGAERTPELSY